MNGSLVAMLACIGVGGAIGGIVNALMTDNGFLMPRTESTSSGASILRPGCLGNALIGAIGALVSWGLYGPFATRIIIGADDAVQAAGGDKIGLSLASFVGAILVGVGGARWLSNEVDKTLLRATAAEAASKQASPALAQKVTAATPAQALKIAQAEPKAP